MLYSCVRSETTFSVMGWQWAGKPIVIALINLLRVSRHAALPRENNEPCPRYEVNSVVVTQGISASYLFLASRDLL